MKILRFLITFISLLCIPILITLFVYSPASNMLKPSYSFYEFTSHGDVIKGKENKMSSTYSQLQNLIYQNWSPPNKKIKQKYIFNSKNMLADESISMKLQDSANEAFYDSIREFKDYVTKNANYTIVFEYNPNLEHPKTVYISKITEQRDSINFIFFMISVFILSLIPAILTYLSYCKFTVLPRLIDDEVEVKRVYKRVDVLSFCFAIWYISAITFALVIGVFNLLYDFPVKPYSFQVIYTPIKYYTIGAFFISFILIQYYELFQIITNKRILKIKNGKIIKTIKLNQISNS